MKSRVLRGACALVFVSLAAGCAADDESFSESGGTDDLATGDISDVAEARNPGSWMYATRCKDIPAVEPLANPEVVVSLDGLTLHLRDRGGTYDRVFPIGPGALENGRSLTPTSEAAPTGVFYTGANTAEFADGRWGYYYPCRIWHEERGVRTPVFAGLPFIRLAGPATAGYGIHGPIDGFTAPNGGALRRGYVSHGCVRMSAADIVEVYGRIHNHPRTAVKIQQAVERLTDGRAVDLAQRWVGAECSANSECNFTNGVCRIAAGATKGFCTLPCTMGCPDRAGEATTFCVRDPASANATRGVCVVTASAVYNNTCARYRGALTYARGVARPDRSATNDVCMPAR